VLAAGLGVPPHSTAAQVGVNVDLTWGISRHDVDRELPLLQRAGVRWVRMNVPWNGVQPHGPGRHDARFVGDVDYAVDRVRRAGIDIVMPIADGVPYWASADPRRHRGSGGRPSYNQYWRPRRFSDYGRFAGWVARRYARRGVHVFEIWNEPNLSRFWPSGPSAREYVAMLRASRGEVKRADPRAGILLGGLYQNDARFLQRIYALRGRGLFDAVADHSYPDGDPERCRTDRKGRPSAGSLCGVENVRRTMSAHGDSARGLWLTEIGWSTWRHGVSEGAQASYIRSALARIRSRYPWIVTALVYNVRNDYWLHGDRWSPEANYGLLRTDFSAKAAYYALAATAARTGWLTDALVAVDELAMLGSRVSV
jgi:hypothetical protein